MCGISGFVSVRELTPEARQSVVDMTRRLTHRGPDDEGFFFDRFAGLGSRRLSIVDIVGGRQPISSEDGTLQVVYNGEIYNHRSLRDRLEKRGHRFKTSSDTEVLVHAYEEHGREMLQSLNGMFALAIWDSVRRTLLLARDPLGVKPLYYAEHGAHLVFASEIKALFSLPFLSREMDEESFELFLAYRFVPSPRTIFRGIRKLGPGELLSRDADGDLEVRRYAPAPPLPDRKRQEEEWIEDLMPALRAATRRQMMGEVPVGVLLSGGIDSAAILAFAAETVSEPLRAYTVGFAGANQEDEVVAAAETARHFGVEHLHVTLSAADYQRCLLPVAWHLDEPLATSSVAPYDALCRLAARQHKVVVCGQGADEPFGGYGRHRVEKMASGPFRRGLSGLFQCASLARPGSQALERSSRIFGTSAPHERFVETFALFPSGQRRLLTGRAARDELVSQAIRPLLDQTEHLDSLDRFLYIDSRFSLADDLLMYGDKIAMASSLEVRVPFLDLELLRLVESIPARLRVGMLTPKRLLRRALAKTLPRSIIQRPKRNFAPPDVTWMDSSAGGPSLKWLLEERSAVSRHCRPEQVMRLYHEQINGRRDWRRQLFALLAFELWHRTYMEPEGTRSPGEASFQNAVSISDGPPPIIP
jgi:asparagine synthase (glutamine-hydrolysing)